VNYVCASCGSKYPLSPVRWRCNCGGLLDITAPRVRVEDFDKSRTGVWRYSSLLPPISAGARLNLGERSTPLVRVEDLGVHLKLEYWSPSGSYKDRGAAILVSRLKADSVKRIVLDSSGNAGAAMATYSAAAGLDCQVFVPAGNSVAKLAQVVAVGGRVQRVEGTRQDATAAAMRAPKAFYASHNWSPDFAAGLGTLGFEMWEQLGYEVPSSVIAPCGNGGILLGVRRGFQSLVDAHLASHVPKLIGIQSTAFNAVEVAMNRGLDVTEPIDTGHGTVAEGIACRNPIRGAELIAAITGTGGSALSVSDEEIVSASLRLAERGYYVEPTAAVGFAGFLRMRELGDEQLGDSPVVVLSGVGLKAGRKLADFRDARWDKLSLTSVAPRHDHACPPEVDA
jgi:threonine synthase